MHILIIIHKSPCSYDVNVIINYFVILQARVNIACLCHQTIAKDLSKSLYNTSPYIQVSDIIVCFIVNDNTAMNDTMSSFNIIKLLIEWTCVQSVYGNAFIELNYTDYSNIIWLIVQTQFVQRRWAGKTSYVSCCTETIKDLINPSIL